MEVYPDFEEFVRSCVRNKVKFLIVGAHALGFHGIIRATKDLDIWIDNSVENAKNFLKTLKIFFNTDFSITLEEITKGENIFQFGYPPIRIYVITHIKGLKFSEAWKKRISSKYGKSRAYYISIDDLIKSKRIAGRKQDKVDLERLKKLKNKRRRQ